MKVFLLQSVSGLGRDGEIKDVAEGYARNFLLPRKMATPATAQLIEKAKRLATGRKSHEEQKLRRQQQRAQLLEGRVITMFCRASSLGNLFAAIPLKEIVATLFKETGIRVSEKEVSGSPIKTLGQHELNVQQGKKVVRIRIEVKPERASHPSLLKA